MLRGCSLGAFRLENQHIRGASRCRYRSSTAVLRKRVRRTTEAAFRTRFTAAVRAVAKHPQFAGILSATPYALRRGGISLRLRTEDPQIVASECGTSLKMLSDHYSFLIEDLRHHEPRPADIEWRAARAALSEQQAGEREPRLGLFARLANGRRRGLRSAQTS
jgi:hypothetical protein